MSGPNKKYPRGETDDSGAKQYADRSRDALMDILEKRIARFHPQYPFKDGCRSDSPLCLEHEMAKSREYALHCLREESPACEAGANLSRIPGRNHINGGRRADVDRHYYNMHGVSRPVNVQKDAHARRFSYPTNKQQRATSCPTPVQQVQPYTVQRLPRLCPRPNATVRSIPSRSISASDPRRYVTPNKQTAAKIPRPKTVEYNRQRTPNYPTADAAAEYPEGTILNTITSTTTTRKYSPQRIPISSAPGKLPSRPYNELMHQQKVQIISNSHQDDALQIDAAYEQTPPTSRVQYSLNLPGNPANIMHQPTTRNAPVRPTASNVDDKQKEANGQERNMAERENSHSNRMRQHQSPPRARAAVNLNIEAHRNRQRHYSPMYQDDFSPIYDTGEIYAAVPGRSVPRPRQGISYDGGVIYTGTVPNVRGRNGRRRRLAECPEAIIIDLTDDDQCDGEDMDAIWQETLDDSTDPNICDDEDNLYERPDYRSHSNHQSDKCTDAMQTPVGTASASPRDEVPISTPSDHQKATLFRCLAQKLSSTYGFISALMSPQKSAEDVNVSGPEECELTRADFKPAFRGNEQLVHDSIDSSAKCEALDPRRAALQKIAIENLVKDAYCPGIIQDTIDGKENFNLHSLNITKSHAAEDVYRHGYHYLDDPMTLLEAFSIRIEKERAHIDKDLNENATKEQIEDSIHKHFGNLNPSDLNHSVRSFLTSERLQEREQVETSKGISLEAEVFKFVTTIPNNTKQKIIAYSGLTKPINDEAV